MPEEPLKIGQVFKRTHTTASFFEILDIQPNMASNGFEIIYKEINGPYSIPARVFVYETSRKITAEEQKKLHLYNKSIEWERNKKVVLSSLTKEEVIALATEFGLKCQ